MSIADELPKLDGGFRPLWLGGFLRAKVNGAGRAVGCDLPVDFNDFIGRVVRNEGRIRFGRCPPLTEGLSGPEDDPDGGGERSTWIRGYAEFQTLGGPAWTAVTTVLHGGGNPGWRV